MIGIDGKLQPLSYKRLFVVTIVVYSQCTLSINDTPPMGIVYMKHAIYINIFLCVYMYNICICTPFAGNIAWYIILNISGVNMRMLEVSGYNGGGGHQNSQDNSPRTDQPSPPSLQLPHHNNSSKEVSPVDSPHSHSPPGHPLPPRHHTPLQLQPNHLPSPNKDVLHYATAFPPPLPTGLANQQNPDPFSALGQLGQDLRLAHPHITQWLQHSSGPHSPVKHEPMSPRQDSHSSGSDYAPADYR